MIQNREIPEKYSANALLHLFVLSFLVISSIFVGGRNRVISHDDVTIGSAFTDITAADCSLFQFHFPISLKAGLFAIRPVLSGAESPYHYHDMRIVLQ